LTAGQSYRAPVLALFSKETNSSCGVVKAGPMYCAGDQKMYFDLSLFNSCTDRKVCDIAEAFLIAREVGHHVQNLLGISKKVKDAGNRQELRMRQELQADCFAGLWAHEANQKLSAGLFDPSVFDAAVARASLLAKDTVTPMLSDAPTLGARQRWFKTGFTIGTVASCNTFSVEKW
jgi:uncharacterized protein